MKNQKSNRGVIRLGENKIRVLINYHGKKGSGPSYSLEWAKGLLECGCEVYAVVSKEVVNIEEWKKNINDDHLYLIDTHKDYSRKDLAMKTVKLYLKGKKEIQKKFSHVTFDFSFHTFYCHWANIVDSFLDIKKVVAICHDPIAHSGTKFYLQYLFKRHYKTADEIITLTKSFTDVIHKKFNIPISNIHYIPHGRMKMYNEYSKTMLNSLAYKEDNINFLFFGFIEHYKGLNILAKAYKELENKYENVTLTIAGNGDFKPYQEQFSKLKKFNLVNRYIRDDEVGALFAGPNIVVVLPYINATQSGVIPVAYEFLTPIIASNTGGLKEQLDDGKIGLLFENGNYKDLMRKMEVFINNKKIWKKQSDLMISFRNTLDWNVLASDLLKLLGIREEY